MPRKKESTGNLNLIFKKVTITNDERCFILRFNDDKYNKNFYYTDFESLLQSVINKYLLKSEAKNIEEVLLELRDLKKEIKNIRGFDEKIKTTGLSGQEP